MLQGLLGGPRLSRFRSEGAPQAYYLVYNAAIVCILPWLAILWHELGFSGGQLGILSGLRPFIAALSGQVLVGFADAHQLHLAVTLVTYVVTFLCRGGMALATTFAAHVLLVLGSEACQAPFSIMSDAAAAAASTSEADFGRKKLYSSIGWGAVAPLSGYIVQRFGVRVSIAVYFGLAVANSVFTVLLPIDKLAKRRASQAGEAPLPANPATKGVRQPLLSDDRLAATGLEERWHGGKAGMLAIELSGSLDPAGTAVVPLPIQDTSALPEKLPPPPPFPRSSSASEGWRIPASPSPVATCGPGLTHIQTLPPPPPPGDASSHPPPASPHPSAPAGTPATRRSLHIAIPAAHRPQSAASMASTQFYSVRSGTSLTNMATPGSALGPGFTPRSSSGPGGGGGSVLAHQVSNMSTLSSLLDASLHSAAEQSQHAALSPFAAACPSPFASLSPGLPFAADPAPAPAGPEEAAGGELGGLPPLSPLAAALHLPRTHHVHPFSFAPAASGPSAHSALSAPLAPAASGALLLSPGHVPSDQAEALAASEDDSTGPLPPLVGQHRAAEALLPAGHEPSNHQGGLMAKTGFQRAAIQVSAVAGAPPAPAPPAAASAANLGVWAGIRHLLKDPHVAAFFFLTGLCGLGYGCIGYLALFLREQGASGVLLGLCQAVNCAGEAAALYTSGWWLAKLGVQRSFNLAMLGWVVRLGAYVLVPLFPSLWLVLAVEVLQGLTFGVCYCTGTVYCRRIAPPHLRSTTQSIFFSLYYGIGPGISGLAGGYIYQAVGMRAVFIVFSCAILAGWLGTLLLLRCCVGSGADAARPQPGDITAEPEAGAVMPAAPAGADGAAIPAASAAQLADRP